MVPRKLTFIFCFSLAALSGARADFQLKPQTEEYDLDGFKFTHVFFSDGERRVTYTPPPNWEFNGDANALVMHPKHKTESEAIVSHGPRSHADAFDEQGTKMLKDDAVSSLPAGSSQIEVVSQEKNPLVIDRKETFLVIVNYTFLGKPQTRSIMFMNRGSEQVRFQLTCRREDFKDLQHAFQTSHYTWQNL